MLNINDKYMIIKETNNYIKMTTGQIFRMMDGFITKKSSSPTGSSRIPTVMIKLMTAMSFMFKSMMFPRAETRASRTAKNSMSSLYMNLQKYYMTRRAK
jgi:hypothetical protein